MAPLARTELSARTITMPYSKPDGATREKDIARYENRLDRAEDVFTTAVERNACPSMNITKFEILARLKQGGFAGVYKARKDDKLYAIKTLTKSEIRRRKIWRGTILEKKFLYAMNNPFVVKIYFKFKDALRVYMMMDYAPYGDLLTETRRQKVPEPKTRKYAFQIVLGLQYVHACGLILRDLKPENILIFEGGRLKLADFGLARFNDGTVDSASGTTPYMAPEMFKRRFYSEAVDWWALGITLYQLMLDGFPFGGSFRDKARTVTRNVLRKPLEDLTDSGLSDEGQDILTKLLRKAPKRRLGSQKCGAFAVLRHPWFKKCDLHRTIFGDELVKLTRRRALRGRRVDPDIFRDIEPEREDPLRADLAEF